MYYSYTGHLGSYPRRLHAHIIECFKDPFANVRSCAVHTAAKLRPVPHSMELILYETLAKDESAKIRLDTIIGTYF